MKSTPSSMRSSPSAMRSWRDKVSAAKPLTPCVICGGLFESIRGVETSAGRNCGTRRCDHEPAMYAEADGRRHS